MYPYVHYRIIHDGQEMETIDVHPNKWWDEDVHIDNEILLSNKKTWNTAFCDNAWCHAKWNKLHGKSQKTYDFTHMWDKKLKATSEQTIQTITHRYRHQYGNYQKETGWGEVKGVKYIVMEADLTLHGKHTKQYTDDVL